MKIWKLISLLLLTAFVGACDDDEKWSDNENGGNAGDSETNVEARFGYEAKTVLKNAGQVLVPVKLAKPVSNAVKVTVAAEKGSGDTDAREGIDFNLPEKVVTIPAGDTVAHLTVDLLDNGKTDNERVVKLNMTGVYGGKLGTPHSASLHIVSNAFVEFGKAKWETWESANVETSSEEVRNSRFIPLTITGEITEPATIVFEVTDSSAIEPTHFSVEKELVVTPGTTTVNVEIKPVDDLEVNDDRIFILKIKEIRGGNLEIGKNNICEVKIISEEVFRSVAFGITSLSLKDVEKEISLPILLDKPCVNNVEVTVGVAATSTAIEGEDYILETETVVIGNTQKGEIKVRILGDKIENADRTLVLELKNATENVSLSQTAGMCTIDIINNDWEVRLSQKEFVVEEDMGKYALKASFTPVDRERVLNLEYESNNVNYFPIDYPSVVKIPANQEEIEIDITVGYSLDYPAENPQLKVKFVACDDSDYETPVIATITAEPCLFRRLTGVWNTAGSGDLPATMTLGILEWKKELSVKFTHQGFENTLKFEWNKDTEELFFVVGNFTYGSRLNFGGELGENWIRAEHGSQWGNISDNVKMSWTEKEINVGQIGGLLWGPNGDVRAGGTAWWLMNNVVLKRN